MKMPRAEMESAVALNELISSRGNLESVDVLDVGSAVFCAEKKTKQFIVKNLTDWISDARNLGSSCRDTIEYELKRFNYNWSVSRKSNVDWSVIWRGTVLIGM